MPEYKDYGYADDQFSHIHSYLLNPLLALLGENKSRIILDIGCGNGWLTNHLIKLGYNSYGIDASVSGIEIARLINPERFYIQDLSTDKLPQELIDIPFNTILATEVIEHLYSPQSFVEYCKKILLQSGGGELILSTPYHGYLKNLALAFTGKMDRHFTAEWEGGHIKFWSFKTLSRLLTANGFKNIDFIGCGRLPYFWKSMIVSARI